MKTKHAFVLASALALVAGTWASRGDSQIQVLSSRPKPDFDKLRPGDDAILISSDPKALPRNVLAYHLFATIDDEVNIASSGRGCSGVLLKKGEAVRLVTAGHCFVVPPKDDGTDVRARKMRLWLWPGKHVDVPLAQKLKLHASLEDRLKARKRKKGESDDAYLRDLMFPPGGGWPDDLARIDLSKAELGDDTLYELLKRLPDAPPAYGQADGVELLLLSGGCNAETNAGCDKPNEAYPMYASRFNLRTGEAATEVIKVPPADLAKRFVMTPVLDSEVRMGDSGGGVFLIGDKKLTFYGVLSASDEKGRNVLAHRLTPWVLEP